MEIQDFIYLVSELFSYLFIDVFPINSSSKGKMQSGGRVNQ